MMDKQELYVAIDRLSSEELLELRTYIDIRLEQLRIAEQEAQVKNDAEKTMQ